MPQKPLVSVIIPFYNRIDWVIESINSVLNQTYDNLEIILVDDGSNSNNKIPNEILSDPRIILLRQKNKGPSSARNIGIKRASGKYIAFLDSDDLFLPEKLEKQIKFMEDNKEIYLSYTSYQYINEKRKLQKIINSGGEIMTYPEIILNCWIATPTVIIRGGEFSKNYLFDETIHIGEDTILWSNIAKSHKLKRIDEVLTYVRIHNQSTAFNKDSQFIGQNNILDYFLQKENKNNSLKSKLFLRKAVNMYKNKHYKKSIFFISNSIFNNPFSIIKLPFFIIKKLLRNQ